VREKCVWRKSPRYVCKRPGNTASNLLERPVTILNGRCGRRVGQRRPASKQCGGARAEVVPMGATPLAGIAEAGVVVRVRKHVAIGGWWVVGGSAGWWFD
jgi:hypothetical protein